MRTIVLFLATVGCTPVIYTDFVRTRPEPRPMSPRPAETVEVFLSERPGRPFTEIGFVEVQEARGSSTSSELLAELRARAGQEGCHALVFLGDNDAVGGTSLRSSVDGDATTDATSTPGVTHHGFRGTCIVYLDPVSVAPGTHE
jgi:hypothetical protein